MSYYESKMGGEEGADTLGEWVKPEEVRLEHAVRINK
jgi:hypothetical protein